MSKLREDLIRAKNAADEERFQREKVERKLKDLELKLNSICTQETVDVRNIYTYFFFVVFMKLSEKGRSSDVVILSLISCGAKMYKWL